MAFIGILLIYLLFVACVFCVGAIFLGAIFGPILIALVSTILFIVLYLKGFFEKYKKSENKIAKYGSIILYYLLIVTMVLSILCSIVVFVVLGGIYS